MRLRMILGFVPLLVCMALGCGGDGTIASGGNFVLRVDDLRREVSNLGPESKYKDTAEGRLAVVNKLAARSYLADEAERRGYGGDDLEQVVKNAEAEVSGEVHEFLPQLTCANIGKLGIYVSIVPYKGITLFLEV